MSLMKKGFVLAELLIVLTILVILTMVAVPNFLDAQRRSNVSRATSDMRTVATAFEAYALDNNKKFPSDAGNGTSGIYRPYAKPPMSVADPSPNFTIGYEVTTPIAYVSSIASLRDPFRWWCAPSGPGREFFGFINIDLRQEKVPGSNVLTRSRVGAWVLYSAGPDKYLNNLPNQGDYSSMNTPRLRNYDPTNGTVSNGDIYRCEAHPDGAPEIATNP